MKGLTPQQLVTITEFVQKHHRFGYLPIEDALPNLRHGLCIKYIDACYDSRDASYWSIKFRGSGMDFAFNANNTYFKQYDNLFDLTMAYLKGELPEKDMFTYYNKFCKQSK